MKLKSVAWLLTLAALAPACSQDRGQPNTAPAVTRPPGAAIPERPEYKLELVFQGLVTLSPREDGTWVFLGNTTDVTQLREFRDPRDPSGQVIAKHQPRLLFPASPPAGVTMGTPLATTEAMMCPPETDLSPGVTWSSVPIAGQHLTLGGTLEPKAATFSGGAVGSEPCEPGPDCPTTKTKAEQAADAHWIRNVSEILRLKNLSGDFRPDLYQPAFAPAGYPILAARVFLDRGLVKSSHLDKRVSGLTKVRVEGLPEWGERAVATQVVVEFTARGPVTLAGRDLTNASADTSPILTIDSSGANARVVIGNDALQDAHCMGDGSDWVMSRNYLAVKPPAEFAGAPDVVVAGNPLPHGSCSPDIGR